MLLVVVYVIYLKCMGDVTEICFTWGGALHKLYIGLKSSRAGKVALAVEKVQVCSTPHTHVPPHTQFTAYRAV